MKRFAAIVLKCVLWMAGIAALLLGALMFVNSRLFDEKPNPEIAAFSRFEAPKLPDEQNAFFHLIGLGVAESGDPQAAGRKWIAEANEVQARLLKGDNSATWPRLMSTAPTLPQKLCMPESGSCLAQARERSEEMRKLLAANERLLVRYRAAHAYPGYAESMDILVFEYPIPAWSPFLNGQRLFLMDAALRVRQGELQAVLSDLGKEIALGRSMVAGARSMIGKMIANRHLNRSLLFLSEVLSSHREQAGAGAREIQALLQPLTPAETQLGDVVRYEFRLARTGIELAVQRRNPPSFFGAEDTVESLMLRWLFQLNATANHLYLQHKAAHAAAMAPAAEVDAVLARGNAAVPVVSDWTLFYDPAGKILIRSMGAVNFLEYIKRMHDLDALVQLVVLQAEMAAKGVKDEDVPQFLAAADKRYANPWTGKPMQWDAKTRQLYFEPRSTRYKDDKIGGTAGRVAVTL